MSQRNHVDWGLGSITQRAGIGTEKVPGRGNSYPRASG